MAISIRKEKPSDTSAIESVTIAAFLDAPHTDHTEHFVIRALRAAGQLSVSLVAEADGFVIGHVAISPVTIVSDVVGDVAGSVTGWFGLGPIAVRPDRQGQGIGTLLMKESLAELRALGAAGCVVLGEPGYYSRFGFRAERSLVLSGLPPEYFQALLFDGSMPSGTVSYHEAFRATS